MLVVYQIQHKPEDKDKIIMDNYLHLGSTPSTFLRHAKKFNQTIKWVSTPTTHKKKRRKEEEKLV